MWCLWLDLNLVPWEASKAHPLLTRLTLNSVLIVLSMHWKKGDWTCAVLYNSAHTAYAEKIENSSKLEASKHSLCYSWISGKSVVTFHIKVSIFCG